MHERSKCTSTCTSTDPNARTQHTPPIARFLPYMHASTTQRAHLVTFFLPIAHGVSLCNRKPSVQRWLDLVPATRGKGHTGETELPIHLLESPDAVVALYRDVMGPSYRA